MNSSLRRTVSLFIDNYHSLRKAMFWKTNSLRTKLYALCHAFEGKMAVPAKLLETLTYIYNQAKWYSPLKASSALTASLLSASGGEPDAVYSRFLTCYKIMKKSGFISTEKLPAAALALYATTAEGSEKIRAEKSILLHGIIRRRHPFTTSFDEYAASVIMAASGRSPADILEDLKATLGILRDRGFYSTSAIQFLSRLLAYDPSPPEVKAERCADIADMLKRMKHRVPILFYGTAGLLSLTGDHWRNALNEVLDTVSLLKLSKCFLPCEREQSLIFSSAFVVENYISERRDGLPGNLRINDGIAIKNVIESHIITCCASCEAPASIAAVS